MRFSNYLNWNIFETTTNEQKMQFLLCVCMCVVCVFEDADPVCMCMCLFVSFFLCVFCCMRQNIEIFLNF